MNVEDNDIINVTTAGPMVLLRKQNFVKKIDRLAGYLTTLLTDRLHNARSDW